jgi:hypothetical protein
MRTIPVAHAWMRAVIATRKAHGTMAIALERISGSGPEEAYRIAREIGTGGIAATTGQMTLNQHPAGEWAAGVAAAGWLESGRAGEGIAVLVPTGQIPGRTRTVRGRAEVTGLSGYRRLLALEAAVAPKMRDGETIHELIEQPGSWRSKTVFEVPQEDRSNWHVVMMDGAEVAREERLPAAKAAAKRLLAEMPPTAGPVAMQIVKVTGRGDGPLVTAVRNPVKEVVKVVATVGGMPEEAVTSWIAGYRA